MMNNQKGVVIIVALFIVALVATLAYYMLAHLERDTFRTTLIIRNAQAEFYAQGSIAWSIDELRNDFLKKKPDRLVDNIPIILPATEVNGYKIQSTIYDAQSRYNINNLSNKDAPADFKHLLKILDPSMTEEKSQALILAILDWIGITKDSKFAEYYAALKTPYRAPHKLMTSISELNLVKGMNPKLFNLLKPYIVALPVQTAINVQTASPEVLASLSESLTLSGAKIVATNRKDKPFLDPQQFADLDVIKNQQIPKDKIVAVSDYFIVETKVEIEKQKILLYTLLERSTKNTAPEMRIIWQSKANDY